MATPIRSFADRETEGMLYTGEVKHSPIANIFDGRRYGNTTNEIDLPSTSLKRTDDLWVEKCVRKMSTSFRKCEILRNFAN